MGEKIKRVKRYTRISNLEFHYKRRDGGFELVNTLVLCQKCHEATHSYGTEGTSLPEFLDTVKRLAIIRADNQCKCTRSIG